MKDFLAISVAAIVGANLRFFSAGSLPENLGRSSLMEHSSSIFWAASLWASS